MQIIHCNT